MDNQVKFWCPRRLVYVTCELILLKFENDAKFHIFTADSIKRKSFSDMATCCLSEENRRLRGVYCFQDRSNDLGKAHLWNVCLLLRDCTAPYPRRLWSSSIKSFKSYCKGGDQKICKINEPISVYKNKCPYEYVFKAHEDNLNTSVPGTYCNTVPTNAMYVRKAVLRECRYYANLFVKFSHAFPSCREGCRWVMMLCCYLLIRGSRQLWQGGHVYEVVLPREVRSVQQTLPISGIKNSGMLNKWKIFTLVFIGRHWRI
jgi:hypothetical protein